MQKPPNKTNMFERKHKSRLLPNLKFGFSKESAPKVLSGFENPSCMIYTLTYFNYTRISSYLYVRKNCDFAYWLYGCVPRSLYTFYTCANRAYVSPGFMSDKRHTPCHSSTAFGQRMHSELHMPKTFRLLVFLTFCLLERK